jgi:hypothetical protein
MTSVDGWSTPDPGSPPDSPFPHVFRPVTLGTMKLRNRIMLPPHGSAIGNLLGSPADAAQHRVLARPGGGRRGWVDAVRGRVRNRIVPGFEPHGYGAEPTILTKARAGQRPDVHLLGDAFAPPAAGRRDPAGVRPGQTLAAIRLAAIRAVVGAGTPESGQQQPNGPNGDDE